MSVNNNTPELAFGTPLIEYVRGIKGNPLGLLMSVLDRKNNIINVGWSLVRSNSNDRFNKDRAYDITLGRVNLSNIHKVTIPFSLLADRQLETFVLRSMKYFRTNNVQVFGRMRKINSATNQLVYTEFTVV